MDVRKNNEITILKGIGILSVVAGHVFPNFTFVYAYHLALFFFVSGYLYNEDKYGYNPYLNIGNRFKACYGKYVLYGSILGVIQAVVNKDSLADFRNYFLNLVVLNNTNPLFGPAWFVLALICASTMMGFIIYFSNIVYKYSESKILKHLTIVIITSFFAYCGIERFMLGFQLYARLEVALFVCPTLICGYYCKRYDLCNKFANLPLAFIGFIIIFWLNKRFNWWYDLCGLNAPMPRYLILSSLGIYSTFVFSKYISKTKMLSKVFEVLGIYSFEIMSFHFLSLKIVDLIYSIIKKDDTMDFMCVPKSYNFYIVYLFVGCFLPILVTVSIKHAIKRIFKHPKISE